MPDERTKSTRPESLDEIVRLSAEQIADQIQTAASWDASEMELQIAAAGALRDFARHAQIKLEGRHNVTIATGRPDSLYGSVIVEYKKPGTLSSTKDAANNQALVAQLKQRFYDMNREEKRNWPSMLGVGTDGKYFIFLRFRDEKWTEPEPLEVNRYSTERFLWALYNLGQKGKPYQPEYLHGDFGAESPVAREGVRTLYKEILATDNPKAEVFFNQWKILFGEVCGFDVENLSDKLQKLAESYEIDGKPQPAPLLFAVHTYYAILIKLLAAEIVSFFNPWMPRQVEKLQSATSSAKLKRELQDLEQGGIFHQMGITNFLEGDLFSWYLGAWTEPVQHLMRKMISKLDEYNPGTFSEDPAQSRDLLKKLYQHLFPKSVRHDLGEYYTPDWLAEHVLNELGYEGDPDKRILDPSCGSGTFLVMAINRVRRWYDLNREKCHYDEAELLKKILANVIGFDLNPLAVMAARTNYLVAIKDLVHHVGTVEIPVYLCDSIMTPAEYGDLFTGAGNVAKVPCSALKPPHLLVPKEIAHSPRDVATYAAVMEHSIQNGYPPDDFISRCREEGLTVTATEAHVELYEQLVALDKANKNGIWARIIKNNFAPLFVGRVDYIAGNPPWVNWESLPSDYRDSMKPLWQSYGLFSLSGSAGRLGGGKKDLSMLFVYTCVDQYLRYSGRLGFVITQTVFKTKGAGDGFRRLRFESNKEKVVIKPIVVHDLSAMQVFEGATNRTAVFVCERTPKKFSYPVAYVQWLGPSRIDQDETLEKVNKSVTWRNLAAIPIEREKLTSPWLTAPAAAIDGIRKARQSGYKGYEGVNSGGLNGCFWIRTLATKADGSLLVENLGDVGKIKLDRIQAVIEADLVYPLLRGRDVSRWTATPSAQIILAQDPVEGKGIAESEMRKRHPKTFSYFKRFEGDREKPKRGTLRGRALFKLYFRPTDPFWSMYNVGPQTLSPWKVLWPEVGHTVRAGVCGPTKIDSQKSVLPDHTIIAVSCETKEEAHFICAMLNSAPAQCAALSYIALHPSPHIMENIAIPAFNRKDATHRRLSELSEACHVAVAKSDPKRVSSLESEIDKAAAEIWGITAEQLRAIEEAVTDAKSEESSDDKDDGL